MERRRLTRGERARAPQARESESSESRSTASPQGPYNMGVHAATARRFAFTRTYSHKTCQPKYKSGYKFQTVCPQRMKAFSVASYL